MRVYFDNCCLQRPFDDQTQLRIRIETEALLAIFVTIESEKHTMIGSEALVYEINQITDTFRRTESLKILRLATESFTIDNEVETLALSFEASGVASMDAVHLALASQARADVFCTVDDKLIRKGRSLSDLNCRVLSLLDLIWEVTE